MALASLLYTEINLFAIVILLLLFFSRKQSRSMPLDEKLFDYLLISIMLVLAFDTGMWLIDGKQFAYARNLNFLLSTCYYLASVLVCYAWIVYCDYKLYGNEPALRKRMLLYSFPMMLCIVLALTSPLTGGVFFVDEANVYHRGPWFWPVNVLSLSYVVIGGVLALVRAKKTDARTEKRECYILAMYMLAPFLGGLLQGFFYGLSLVWVCTVISAVMIYIYVQNQQISTDALTGLNNRRRFDKYLDWISKAKSSGRLFAIMIDADDFKAVNATYGHAAGDGALIHIAELLKRACASRNDFLARIGGDEFALLCLRDDEAGLLETIADIEARVRAFNASGKMPYAIVLSIGYSVFDAKNGQSVDAFILEADTRMYEAKAAHKRALARDAKTRREQADG